MPTSAVVDASILVSAFLFPGSIPGLAVKLGGQAAFAMHISPLLLDETRTAFLSTRLRDAYGHDEEAVAAWCAVLRTAATLSLAIHESYHPLKSSAPPDWRRMDQMRTLRARKPPKCRTCSFPGQAAMHIGSVS
jgi:hypothetical protein